MEQKWRKPTKEELEKIDRYYNQDDGIQAKDYYVIVLENYTSDCPAYSGKIIICIWGLPEIHDLFITGKNGELEKVVDEMERELKVTQ